MNDAELRHERVVELFGKACELSAEERARFLDRECGGDDALRREVEEYLELDEHSVALDASPAGKLSSTVAQPAEMPERLGQYEILGVLGEGGMGVVYHARQAQPDREVALKVMRGFGSELRRRFQAEAQLLARLRHPGIAQVYEVGSLDTELGPQPFFSMELVDGGPLDKHCREETLSRDGILELLAEVCDAVHHAHQRGVIHRDLKPSNILVDSSGRPKVLDFGIARLNDASVEETLGTQTGQLLGTLPYMSPEQVSGRKNEVDLRSDVYAMGVVAYQLLAGQLPLDLSGRPVVEAVRVVSEDEPSTLGAFHRDLRGDVETIVATAMAKDRSRRYATMAALGEDLRRFLRHEPIVARPYSALYQFHKLARRHRALFLGGAIAILALVAGLAVAIVEARKAKIAAGREAEAAELARVEEGNARRAAFWASEEADRANRSAEQAKASLADANAAVGFLSDLLSAVNADDINRDVLVADVLEVATDEMKADETLSPAVRARLNEAIGFSWLALSGLDLAIPHIQRSLDYHEKQPTIDEHTVYGLRMGLGQALMNLSRDHEALTVLEACFEAARNRLGENHPDTLQAMSGVAQCEYKVGFQDRGLARCREAVQRAEDAGQQRTAGYCIMLTALSGLEGMSGNLDRVESLSLRGYVATSNYFGRNHSKTLEAHLKYVAALNAHGKYQRCIEELEPKIPLFEEICGPTHHETISAYLTLASLYITTSRFPEAEAMFQAALDGCGDGPDRFALRLDTKRQLFFLLQRMQRLEDSLPVAEEIYAGALAFHGTREEITIRSKQALASTLIMLEHYERGSRLLLECQQEARQYLQATNTIHPAIGLDVANFYRQVGRFGEATAEIQRILPEYQRIHGPEHLKTVMVHRMGAIINMQAGRPDDAIDELEPILDKMKELLGADNALTLQTQEVLIRSYLDAGLPEDAWLMADEALEVSHRVLGETNSMSNRLQALMEEAEEGGGNP